MGGVTIPDMRYKVCHPFYKSSLLIERVLDNFLNFTYGYLLMIKRAEKQS